MTKSTATPDELLRGEIVGHFQVRHLIGLGGMGRVYLARDMKLGRSVALKLIRSTSVDVEARITAKFNHPHIVTIFEVGRHRAGPYLALEYLDGESLWDRMRHERISVDDSCRILRAIADALAHAHAQGVCHCDLKPSNVMLPKDGRVRVVDFGLASEASDGSSISRGGTVDWMAPEQWRGEPVSDRSDIWALAVIAHQLLTGEHPFGDAADGEVRRNAVLDPQVMPRTIVQDGVSHALIAMIARSLSRVASARPTAAEWLTLLDNAISGAVLNPATDNPFRGLAVFEESHTPFFFGRDHDIDAFLERLRDHTLLPIVGPSGVGKSSFVLAGLIPRLRMRERWTILSMRPGGDPFVALARCILAVGDASVVANELRSQPALLACRLATLAETTNGHVLLFVDQLEELFTQGLPVRDREQFLGMLASAADDPREPVRVIYTVRDDYLGRVSNFQSMFPLGPLDETRLRRVIMGPLERLKYRFDRPDLVDEMLADVRDSSAALPLLQFACRTLWDARDQTNQLLLESAYRSQGGVAGALARHADTVLKGMVEADQHVSRQMLTRLVVGTHARRIVARRTLLADLPDSAASVLERLLSARLLASIQTPGESDTSIEIAHESLLTTWTRLAKWLEESGEGRRFLSGLEDAVSVWEQRGRRAEETWPVEDIRATRQRAQQLEVQIPSRVSQFLAEGERRADALRRRTRLQRIAITVVVTLVVTVALVAAQVFRQQRDEANDQAEALRLAGSNLGRAELELEAFDWIDGQPQPVSTSELPELQLRLYAPAFGDIHRPGAPLPDELVHISRDSIEAPGGLVFLRIDGRGRGGERCAASWLRLISLPGYADRDSVPRLTITFPTCQASLAHTVQIPEGEFIYGGSGTPATRDPGYVQPEVRVRLDSFHIDQTEVSNAMFLTFSKHAELTGYPATVYPSDAVLERADAFDSPATSIDAFEAEAYCRFMGKRLPTDYEWTKAARGGLVVDGLPNPEPRRLYPWGGEFAQACVNLHGEDAWPWMAPVGALECGASPYGLLNMAGNVEEWISRTGQTGNQPLRIVRGGSAISPVEREHGTTVFRNMREADYSDFVIGVRCVMDDDPERGSSWEKH